jgi:hypothetical protein
VLSPREHDRVGQAAEYSYFLVIPGIRRTIHDDKTSCLCNRDSSGVVGRDADPLRHRPASALPGCQLAFLHKLGIVAHRRVAVQLADELRLGRMAEKTN